MGFEPGFQGEAGAAAAEGDAPAWCLAFVDGQLLLPPAQEPGCPIEPLPPGLTRRLLIASATDRHFLGRLDGAACWALRLAEAPPGGWQALPLRAALATLPAPLGAVAGRAAQVLEWDRTHRHCGACGTPTERHASERSRVCPACGLTAYPRIAPAMMALIWRPGELLLARSPQFPAGMYSALAGFVEPGESLEDCLQREVREEVGVEVESLRYFGSQSWPFPHSLMLAFTARWAGGEIVPEPGEIEDARWFALDALPAIPPTLTIAGRLIREAVKELRTA